MDARLELCHRGFCGACVVAATDIKRSEVIMKIEWEDGVLDSRLAFRHISERHFFDPRVRQAFAQAFTPQVDDRRSTGDCDGHVVDDAMEKALLATCADRVLATFLLQDRQQDGRVAASRFDWIHNVVSACGPDLGIPLALPSCEITQLLSLPSHCQSRRRDTSAEALRSLLLRVLPQSVTFNGEEIDSSCALSTSTTESAATAELVRDREEVTRWYELCREHGILVESEDGCDDAADRLSIDLFLRYVAWIRSRWVSCHVKAESDSSSPSTTKKKKSNSSEAQKKSSSMELFAIVPVVEKLNHSPHSLMSPTVDWGVRVTLEAAPLSSSQGPNPIAASSRAALETGDEVLINYGPLSNFKLLSRYGFVLEKDCPAEFLSVELPPVSSHVREAWHVLDGMTATCWTIREGAIDSSSPRAPWSVLFTMLLSRFGSRGDVLEAARSALPQAFEVASDDDDVLGGLCGGGAMTTWDDDSVRALLTHATLPDGVAKGLCDGLRALLGAHSRELQRACSDAELLHAAARADDSVTGCAAFFFWAAKYSTVQLRLVQQALLTCDDLLRLT